MSINYKHLPTWLAENRVFRTLFLVKKVYLEKSKRAHYSQFGEDIAIARVLNTDRAGFFVDVGCYHPRRYSNTWMLYQKGWRGINIDIDSIKIDAFNLLRKEDINIVSAVSNKNGEVSYYSNGFYSLSVSLDDDFVAGKEKYRRKTTKCRGLSEIIDDTKYKGRQIDFLSVDVEGHDVEVLRSLDFERYSPRLVAVETHFSLLRDVVSSSMYQFLVEKGYELVGWCGLTLLMASPSLQEEMK